MISEMRYLRVWRSDILGEELDGRGCIALPLLSTTLGHSEIFSGKLAGDIGGLLRGDEAHDSAGEVERFLSDPRVPTAVLQASRAWSRCLCRSVMLTFSVAKASFQAMSDTNFMAVDGYVDVLPREWTANRSRLSTVS